MRTEVTETPTSNVIPEATKEMAVTIQRAKVAPDIEAALPSITGLSREERSEALQAKLPEDFTPYSDKYFLRTHDILEAEKLNPFVRAQIFVRQGPGAAKGIDEAIAIIDKYTDLRKNGGRVYALEEGATYDSRETLLVIEARIQDIIALETLYLGVISAETTKANDGIDDIDLDQARQRMKEVVDAAGGRPVTYFGARHWRYDRDAAIALAAFEGGATGASTDAGAKMGGLVGQGTIPHALENIYAWKYGRRAAVTEATRAFDRVIDPAVPRIALIDYDNREIEDTLKVARTLGDRLEAIRVDTCGENVAQGALTGPDDPNAEVFRDAGIELPEVDSPQARYWYGRGVTVTGVYALRNALDQNGFGRVKIILTSGFGDVRKVKAFVDAEKVCGVKLFDGLGVGGIYSPCRMATMDIVAVGDSLDTLEPVSKVGRPYRPNPRLQEV